MIEQLQTASPNLIGLKVSGKLHDADYKQYVPMLERQIAPGGHTRLFAQFEDFHGWDFHAAWDDFRFGVKHYGDFDRIALVGENRWQAWMAAFCKPFTRARVRYFDAREIDDAWTWLREGPREQAPESPGEKVEHAPISQPNAG